MNMKKILIFISFVFLFASCDILEEILGNIDSNNTSLTEQEVISGLKEALKVGTNKSVSFFNKTDGFYKNSAFKILIPEEAQFIVENRNHTLLKAVGISKMIDDVELRMNRAAEDAVKEAKPIFVNAITSMTINDAFSILNGTDTAATHYLRTRTYSNLKTAFKPKIKIALDKPLIGEISANKAWSDMINAYNKVAKNVPGWNTINASLEEHVTDKSLKALFVKVAEEEKNIRNNPVARINDILKKVFGKQ